MSNDTGPDVHYFASTVYGWIADADLFNCLLRLKKTGGYSGPVQNGDEYLVYKVPGKTTDNYRINMYAPEVEGVEFIGKGVFGTAKKKPAKRDGVETLRVAAVGTLDQIDR